MKKLLIVISILLSSLSYSQIVADNTYAFGFENVFMWNSISFNNKIINTEDLRIVFYEDIDTFNETFILCAVKKVDVNKFEEFSKNIKKNKEFEEVLEIKNPYSEQNTLLFKDRETSNQYQAIIFHFGYLLHISYTQKNIANKELFKKFVKSYINIQVTL